MTYCNLSVFVMRCLSSINYLSEIDNISNVAFVWDGDKQFKLKTLAIRGLNFRGKNFMYFLENLLTIQMGIEKAN